MISRLAPALPLFTVSLLVSSCAEAPFDQDAEPPATRSEGLSRTRPGPFVPSIPCGTLVPDPVPLPVAFSGTPSLWGGQQGVIVYYFVTRPESDGERNDPGTLLDAYGVALDVANPGQSKVVFARRLAQGQAPTLQGMDGTLRSAPRYRGIISSPRVPPPKDPPPVPGATDCHASELAFFRFLVLDALGEYRGLFGE